MGTSGNFTSRTHKMQQRPAQNKCDLRHNERDKSRFPVSYLYLQKFANFGYVCYNNFTKLNNFLCWDIKIKNFKCILRNIQVSINGVCDTVDYTCTIIPVCVHKGNVCFLPWQLYPFWT